MDRYEEQGEHCSFCAENPTEELHRRSYQNKAVWKENRETQSWGWKEGILGREQSNWPSDIPDRGHHLAASQNANSRASPPDSGSSDLIQGSGDCTLSK